MRAAQYLILGGKARALMHGRYHVGFEDIRALALPVLRHRILHELPRAVRARHDRPDHRAALEGGSAAQERPVTRMSGDRLVRS